MERTEIGIGNMRIDVVDDNVVYINLNGWTYYIDDSTKEQILEKYKEHIEKYRKIHGNIRKPYKHNKI